MSTVQILNTATGKVGSVPERLFLSGAFDTGEWELYDGPVDPDCGCPSLRGLPDADEDQANPEPEKSDETGDDITEEEE